MGFDASGTFTRSAGVDATGNTVWQDDAAAGIKILADRHDTHDQDLANGLSLCLLRNGAGAPTDNISWGGYKITNLGNPTSPQDVATKHYVDNPDAATKARSISGAGLDGRLNFTALTGVNGIGWTGADLSWVAKLATASPVTKNRLVLNDKKDATGTDVVTMNDDGSAAFAGAVTAPTVTATGTITAGSIFDTTATTCILSATSGGQILLRPNGPTSAVEQLELTSLGILVTPKDLYVGTAAANAGGTYAGLGVRGRIGSTLSYGSYWQNFNWNGTNLVAYANASIIGNLTYTCDYRIKKNIHPLGSMWDRVKALNPISYSQKAYDIWADDDTEQWGFMAHELQDSLTAGAASGVKDGPEVQSPNLLAIIAGLTRALQEAMARIEALEAA